MVPKVSRTFPVNLVDIDLHPMWRDWAKLLWTVHYLVVFYILNDKAASLIHATRIGHGTLSRAALSGV